MPRSPPTPYRGPVVDVHTHPMLDATPILGTEPHSAEDYLREARGLDVRHVGILTIAPRARPARTRRQNDQILRLAGKDGGRFYPVCSVHPSDGRAALREIDRVVRAGARCLKLHPNTQDFDVAAPEVGRVVARAAAHGLPVLFDAYSPFDADQPGKFVRLAIAHPDARLILAHALGTRYAELLVYEILARYPWWRRNVWIDLSATAPLLSGGPLAESFVWVLRKAGIDRLLFGSDYPLDRPRAAARAVRSLGFTRAELERIFYANAAELFGFDRSDGRPGRARGLDRSTHA